MRAKKTFTFFVFVIAVFYLASMVSGSTIAPFGFLGNPLAVFSDGTFLLKLSPVANVSFFQNVFDLENFNALLNEEEIVISKDRMKLAIAQGINLSGNIEVGAYVHNNLFGLRIIPFAGVDGLFRISVPKTIAQLLFDETRVESNLSSSADTFFKSNIKASAGLNIFLGQMHVGASVFAPLFYSAPGWSRAFAEYRSSAEPAEARARFDLELGVLSALDLNKQDEIVAMFQDSEKLSKFLDDTGILLSFGFGNESFGIALKDVQIRPAKAHYMGTLSVRAAATYSASGTTIDATSNVLSSPFTFSKLVQPMEVSESMKVSAYLKSDGFLMWGIFGTYSLDGDWAAKAYAGLNLVLLKAYYVLGVAPGSYSHSVGAGFNLGLLNADIQATMYTSEFIPSESATPGFGLTLRIAGGI